jgi:biotin carboxyl carrier protein
VYLEDLDGDVSEVSVLGARSAYVVDGRRLTEVGIEAGRLTWTEGDVEQSAPALVDIDGRIVCVAVAGITETFSVRTRIAQWGTAERSSAVASGDLVAPFPALVAQVEVKPGDIVEEGDVLVVIEAMKMLHSLAATGSGVVAAVLVGPGAQVDSGDVLIRFEETP